MQQAKALISLRVCAGWYEPLLVAHTTLLEISCTGSINKQGSSWALTVGRSDFSIQENQGEVTVI